MNQKKTFFYLTDKIKKNVEKEIILFRKTVEDVQGVELTTILIGIVLAAVVGLGVMNKAQVSMPEFFTKALGKAQTSFGLS